MEGRQEDETGRRDVLPWAGVIAAGLVARDAPAAHRNGSGRNAVMLDGSVRFLSRGTPAEAIRPLTTLSSGDPTPPRDAPR